MCSDGERTTKDRDKAGLTVASDRGDVMRAQLVNLLGVPFTTGNEVIVLRNGDEIFPSMLQAIENAEHSIEFLTFVYWSGDIAVRFAEALSTRARDGVEVRVLLDSFGTWSMPRRLVRLMRSSGVEVRWFHPLLTWRVWTWNNRTHRKVLVCDGSIGFTGGVGIAKQWEGDARGPTEWRDTHFRFVGPAVRGLRAGVKPLGIEAFDILVKQHPDSGPSRFPGRRMATCRGRGSR